MKGVMKTHESKLALCVGLFVLAVAASADAQGNLVGPSTRNGSFEDGVLAPWGSGHDVRAIHDAAFASEGTYYASFQSSLVRPVLMGQSLLPSPNDGLVFILSFDARMDTPGLDMLSPSIDARTPEGASLNAIVTAIVTPPLTTSGWQSYQYQLEMPAIWNNAGVHLGISFSRNQPLGGITHYAYLDNVILQQIPEPSALALLGLGGSLFAASRLRQPCENSTAHTRPPIGIS
jgi:hypothetical protein